MSKSDVSSSPSSSLANESGAVAADFAEPREQAPPQSLPPAVKRSVLAIITHFVIERPRGMLVVLLLALAAFIGIGVPGISKLLPSGYQDPNSESFKATATLAGKFGQGDLDLTLLVRSSSDKVTSDSARLVGLRLIDQLSTFPHVASVQSPWNTTGPASASMVSKDGRTALVVVGISGGEVHAPEYAQHIADTVSGNHHNLTVTAGGEAIAYSQMTHQAEIDLLVAESIAIPITFVVLVWVFGGVIAALLPLLVGGFAIAGTTAILRIFSFFTDVSVFALNLTTALGFALAIDYTLLIITRYREEAAAGLDRRKTLVKAIQTAGRTVIFSGIIVSVSMAALALFPMFFMRSFAYAGVAVVAFAAISAVVVTATLITILGDRINALDIRCMARRVFGRSAPVAKSIEHTFWYRWARFVMRRRIAVGLAVIAMLLVLGIPFLNVKFGFPDDRVLASSLSARQVGDTVRADFAQSAASNVSVVVSGKSKLSATDLDRYAMALSKVENVDAVAAPDGTYVDGRLVGLPVAPTGLKGDSAFLTVVNSTALYSKSSEKLLDKLHAVRPPSGTSVGFTGLPQINHDAVGAVRAKLPWVFGLIAVFTFILLVLQTGSIILPIKALVLNLLSFSATFGAIVWIFQQGHLGGLGTATTSGTLIFNCPFLLFCVAFGLSMDYEVFVVARIREYWLKAPNASNASNDEAVALGLGRTGRVVAAAALIMTIAFGALMSAKTSFTVMIGFGIAFSVLVDSVLIRSTLVPAFMSVAGRFNWWAPARVARWSQRLEVE